MHIDIQARNFALTPALAAAVRSAARAAAERTGHARLSMQVRLFDVNGARGGIDKCCLISARSDSLRRTLVTTSFHGDLYQAIAHAFEKLGRRLLAATHRPHTLRRRTPMHAHAPEAS